MKKSVTIISVAAAGAVAVAGVGTGAVSTVASVVGPLGPPAHSGALPGVVSSTAPTAVPTAVPSAVRSSVPSPSAGPLPVPVTTAGPDDQSTQLGTPWPTVVDSSVRPSVTVPTATITTATPTVTPSVTVPTAGPSLLSRPSSPTPTTPAPTPTATPGTLLAGPSQAPACSGVLIKPTDNAADVVEQSPAGATLCFAAGLHRIDRPLRPKSNQTLGSDQGAVLTGSVPLTGWTATGGDWVVKGVLPPAYGRTGQCEDNVANICHLREQLFLDGKHLKRVATRDKVVPGTFYGDYAGNAVYLGDDPAGRSVEMSKTPTAIESGAPNVTVRGLTVEHFASAPQAGAVVLAGGWRVYANDIRWNHAVGAMLVNADGATLDRNLIQYNGQLGVGQYSSVNGTISNNQISNNNTDGFWIADWESGGIKTTWSTSGTVKGNLIKDNRGVGLWSDAYDDGRTFSNNQIVGNAADGIRYEIGRNGVIENNTITGNGFGTGRGSGTSLWDGGGINVNTSVNVQVRNNIVAGNVNGISIQSRTRGSGPWGQNVLRDVIVTGNEVTMKGGTTATGMVQNSGAAVPAGEVLLKTNTYLLDSLTANRFQKFGEWYSAVAWQRAGLDAGSRFVVGRAGCSGAGAHADDEENEATC